MTLYRVEPTSPTAADTSQLAIAAVARVLLSETAVTGAILLPATASAAVDSDIDGLTDDFELRGLTDPQKPDSDRDGLTDGTEVKSGTNPRVPII